MKTYMIKSKSSGKYVVEECSYTQEYTFQGSAIYSEYALSNSNLENVLTFESVFNTLAFIEKLEQGSIYHDSSKELLAELDNLIIVAVVLP